MTAISGVIFQLIADPFAENWQAWGFSDDKILGLWLFNFPVENILFFILVPIAISSAVLTFIYYQETDKFNKLFKKK